MSEPKSILIGGITGGIGRAVAEQALAAGWSVAGYARDAERLAALAAELPGLTTTVADAREPGQVDRAVQAALESQGRIDGYAHCIGSILLKPAHLTTPDEWRETLATNLDTAFHALRAVLGPMQAAGAGTVIFVSTAAAQVGLPSHEAIAAAKAGLEGLVRSSAASYAARNVRVNAVAPGLVETALSAPVISSPAARQISEKVHPLGRIGRPEEVASLIRWLLGDDAQWVTGQVWGIDGGLAQVRPRPRA
jgi:NAD(P)-dependent dehydrogenase (short-subunit alcohol dehydrogenase family)